jgi:hypothetical protein
MRIFFCLIFVCAVISVSAQDRKFINSQLKFSLEYLPESKIKGDSVTNNFQYSKAQVGFVLPVLSNRFALSNDLKYRTFLVLANAHAAYALSDYSFLQKKHQLLNAVAGPSVIYNSGNKNTYIAGLTAGIAQDINSFNNTAIRLTGHAVFKRKINGNFSFHLGAVYTYAFARPMLLPLAGCVIRTSSKSKLKISLPLSISFLYKTNEFDMLTLFIQPDGEQFTFSASGEPVFASYDPQLLRMRYRSFKTGLNYKIGFGGKVFFTPEAGFSLKRRIAFADGPPGEKNSFYKADVNACPYIKVALRVLLGDLRWKRNGDNFLLNDERLDYYDIDDPAKL